LVTADELAVWLYGDHVATIERHQRRPRLTYTQAALDRYALGTPLLSLSLPVRAERYPQGVVRAFLDGLLPEGEPRRAIARDGGIPPGDTYGLIRALGRDCAGALVIQPADEPAPPPATTTTAEPLSDDELESLIRDLQSAPLGVGGRVRISLAGVQEKLVLTRMPDGRWGRPVDGTPSTHILKPEIAAYPQTVENEALCMRIARHLGVEAAHVETTEIVGRKLIVVERFDRQVVPDGRVIRIHQEDLCQATGIAPELKYEEDGGPSFRTIARILATIGGPDSLERLLQSVVVHCLVGNGDAHAKNYSLLHDQAGSLHLSPLYDVLSTLHYGDDELAMRVDDVQRISRVTGIRIVNEARGWDMGRTTATDIVADLLANAADAIDAARDETPGAPDKLVELIRTQLHRLRSE
jgi:serine/threonine-protein kinase HipA